MHTVLYAIIYLPAGVALDSIYARQCMEHVTRHGYELRSIVQSWPAVEQLLCDGSAQVVVFASQEHCDPNRTPRIEFVGDETQDIVRLGRARPRNELRSETGDDRHRRPRLAH